MTTVIVVDPVFTPERVPASPTADNAQKVVSSPRADFSGFTFAAPAVEPAPAATNEPVAPTVTVVIDAPAPVAVEAAAPPAVPTAPAPAEAAPASPTLAPLAVPGPRCAVCLEGVPSLDAAQLNPAEHYKSPRCGHVLHVACMVRVMQNAIACRLVRIPCVEEGCKHMLYWGEGSLSTLPGGPELDQALRASRPIQTPEDIADRLFLRDSGVFDDGLGVATCPGCGILVIRTEGCNHMQCQYCFTCFCYQCQVERGKCGH